MDQIPGNNPVPGNKLKDAIMSGQKGDGQERNSQGGAMEHIAEAGRGERTRFLQVDTVA